MYGHQGMMWGFGWWWTTIFWILIIVGIVFLIRWLIDQGRTNKKMLSGEKSALEILKRRYAKGEINKEEFEQKKKDLLS
jgi:putative membrane protein